MKTRTAAGLEGLRMHDCRHFYAGRLQCPWRRRRDYPSVTAAAARDAASFVQRALGHAKATTTLNTYSHLWPTAEDRTHQAAEDMLLEALAGEENQNLADSVRTTGTK
jgi:integrase